MKYFKTWLFILFSILFLGVKGQQNHFIYIQTENKQPFYVKMNEKVYNSSASGYLVISKLKNGTYDFSVGFPKKEWPEQHFSCLVDNKDFGYLVKNFEERGWGLFNLQSLEVLMARERNDNKKADMAVETKTDQFSILLSDVVNDPSIKQVEQVRQPETTAVVPTTASVQSPIPDSISGTSTDTGEVDSHIERSYITRQLLNKNLEGTEMVFVDSMDGENSTITVFIPREKEVQELGSREEKQPVPSLEVGKKPEDPEPVITIVEQKSVDTPYVQKTTETVRTANSPSIEYNPKEEPKKAAAPKPADSINNYRFIELEPAETGRTKNGKKKAKTNKSGKGTDKDVEERIVSPSIEYKDKEVGSSTSPLMINSDCKDHATEDDFIKARKKMAREDNEESMVSAAKKIFKSRCFTVEQVKNLSVLFLKDKDRYAFFDMAYPFVSDSHNFKNLQAQLTDSYYINRFQVMIRH